jgi:hypothetical protein
MQVYIGHTNTPIWRTGQNHFHTRTISSTAVIITVTLNEVSNKLKSAGSSWKCTSAGEEVEPWNHVHKVPPSDAYPEQVNSHFICLTPWNRALLVTTKKIFA